jgi:hypothetical protein
LIFLVRAAALFLIILLTGCSRQFHLQTALDEGRTQFAIAGAVQEITDFKGSGVITIAENGKRSSGRCDVRFKSGNEFKMQVYSPFGTTAARVDADSSGGYLSAGNDHYNFMLEDNMQAVPLGWGRHLTFAQFIQILIGKMPGELNQLASRPDSLSFDKKAAVAIWSSDTLAVQARIDRKSETVERVTLDYNLNGDTFTLQFARFKNGLAGEIVIRSDSKNYISLKYDTFKVIK